MSIGARSLVTVVLLCSSALAQVHAQGNRRAGSIIIRAGTSVGTLKENCENCSGTQISSFSRFTFEGQVLKRLGTRGAIGVEGMLWRGTYLGLHRRAVLLSVVGSWRPAPSLGLSINASAGYLTFKEHTATSTAELKSVGIGLQIGAGYVIPVASSISVMPFVQYLRSLGSKTTVDGSSSSAHVSPKLLRFGMLLQWQ